MSTMTGMGSARRLRRRWTRACGLALAAPPRRAAVLVLPALGLALSPAGCGGVSTYYARQTPSPPVLVVTTGPGPAPTPTPRPPRGVLWQDRFDGPDGLITNEYAYWNFADPAAARSPGWDVTSGSLFRD